MNCGVRRAATATAKIMRFSKNRAARPFTWNAMFSLRFPLQRSFRPRLLDQQHATSAIKIARFYWWWYNYCNDFYSIGNSSGLDGGGNGFTQFCGAAEEEELTTISSTSFDSSKRCLWNTFVWQGKSSCRCFEWFRAIYQNNQLRERVLEPNNDSRLHWGKKLVRSYLAFAQFQSEILSALDSIWWYPSWPCAQ